MSFLNPGLLGSLAPLVALPLLIHLFNRHFPKMIPFPDLERLRKSIAERSRLVRWRHWLMTLLRTLAVLLALLAFLKPVLPRFGSDEAVGSLGGRRVLLVVDHSFSLEHRQGAGTSAARHAQVEAGKILATLGSRDRSNAILASSRPRWLLPEFAVDHERVRTLLAATSASYERADVAEAVALAASRLEGRGAGTEIYFLSDFQRSNWADASFNALPEGARLFFVDMAGDAERGNTALVHVELSAGRVAARAVVVAEVRAANWTADPLTLPVEAIIDGRTSVAGTVSIQPWSTGRTSLEFRAPESDGFHTLVLQTPEDALPADNRRYARFEVRRREEVLVVSDAPAERSGARFVTTALDPFEDQQGAYAPRRLDLLTLTTGHLASASRLILTGIGKMDRETAVRLVSFLEHGGGLIYFLDGDHDGANLQLVDEVAARTVVPFNVAGRLTSENFGGAPQKIAKGDFRSPYLRIFRGENRQALGLLDFYETRRSLPTVEGEIILWFADGSPAMGVSSVGLGTAIFCNFTPAELGSNLARQRVFPAWIQELVTHLKPEAAAEEFHEVGSEMTAELWQTDFEAAGVKGPGGEGVTAKLIPKGDRVEVAFEAGQPGVYRVGALGEPRWAGVANISPKESDLRAMDPGELTDRANKAPPGSGFMVSGARDYEELTAGRPVFYWFVLAMAGMLLVEMLLFRRFQRPHASTSRRT